MRLTSITVENFRCYKSPITVNIGELTTFVGKNDIGKSTLLEAIEIFFNNQLIKCEQADLNIFSGENKNIIIICEFDQLPTSLSVDSGAETNLKDEFLLTNANTLKIKKVYDCSKKAPTADIFIVASHPTAEGVSDLLELKEKDLQKIVKDRKLDVGLKGNPLMRQAIWQSTEELNLKEVEIPVSKPKEDSKRIWEQIESYLPLFALFQSDRNSQDSDSEVQNPMKAAIATAISEVQEDIERIQQKVREKAEEIAFNTHEALKTIDPQLANQLVPQFVPPTTAKWTGLFNIGMDTDDGIPLNKRGSGIRRMILVSFFKAEAERRLRSSNKRSIIYALEEPETAQHPNNQKILIESFKELSNQAGCQVILTTHSPGLAGELPAESIRFVTRNEQSVPIIQEGSDIFEEVAKVLGVTPDSRVKVILCLEGPTDVIAMKEFSRILHEKDNTIINLTSDPRVAIITLGGSTLKHWVSENYLKNLGRPEVHIYDGDVATYRSAIDHVNLRGNGSWGTLCKKHEIESYLHTDAIIESHDVIIPVTDTPGTDGKGVPRLFAEIYSQKHSFDGVMKDNNAKVYLGRAFEKMTYDRLSERDPDGEVQLWFSKISAML